jgi:DNA end-binding protein Ku
MPEVVQLKEDRPGREIPEGDGQEGEPQQSILRTTWTGSIRIGLVNIPVKALSLTRDKRISFRMLHRSCKTPISFKRFCQEGEEVPLDDIVYGYQLQKNKYVILEKKEIDKAKPESKKVIRLDRFVNFFEIDPHYFDKTYVLLPDNSEEAYSLLRAVMEKTGKAAIGRMTISSKERAVIVHYYQKAIVATTLKYADEVNDPEKMQPLQDLPVPGEKELKLAEEIVKGLTGDLELAGYQDEYRKRIESLVKSKIDGIIVAPEKGKAKPPAKNLMDALRKTAESLK